MSHGMKTLHEHILTMVGKWQKKKKKLKSETQVLQKQLQWRLMKKGIVIHLNNTMLFSLLMDFLP